MEMCADVNVSLLYYVSIFYRKEKKRNCYEKFLFLFDYVQRFYTI